MSRFPDPLILTPFDDGVNWRLIEDFEYLDSILGSIVVPKGFITDGGSVPALFRNIIAPMGKGLKAFIVHDWLYGTQLHTRLEADLCLERALHDCNFDVIGIDVIIDAVRIGGEIAWNEDQKNVSENFKLLTKNP